MSATWTRRSIKAIKANPNNPRLIKDERFQKLVQSIKDFPEMLELRPIVVNAAGVVLGGNMRLKACQAAGLTEVPVIAAESLTEAQQREFVIKDNVGFGEWEWDALANAWDAAELTAWGLELPAVDAEPSAGLTDPDDVPDTPTEPVTKPGDLIVLGDHRLLCGDSQDVHAIAKLQDNATIGMIFTDPPYGMRLDTDYTKMPNNSIKSKKYIEVTGDDDDFDAAPFIALFDHVPEQFWWGADWYYESLPPHGSWIVWDKRHEASDGLTGNHFEMLWSRQKHRRFIIRHLWAGFVARNKDTPRVHPTEKPVAVLAQVIEAYSTPKTIIADFFLGSGTTLIAAEQTGRICYGIEIEPRYCDVIVKRWQNFTGKTATYADTGQPVALT